MADRATAVLVFDGLADWEPAFALTGLRQWGHRSIATYGYSRAPAMSMGGLTIVPARDLDDLDPAATNLLLLPGGDAWTTGYPSTASSGRWRRSPSTLDRAFKIEGFGTLAERRHVRVSGGS